MSNNLGNATQTPFNIDLNSASIEDLQRLPQIGTHDRAMAIVFARPFTRWEQVAHVQGFTKEMAAELQKGGARFDQPAA